MDREKTFSADKCDGPVHLLTLRKGLKGGSCPRVSNVNSPYLRLTKVHERGQFCAVIGYRHKFHCKWDGPQSIEIDQ